MWGRRNSRILGWRDRNWLWIGVVGNIVVDIVGAFIGAWLFPRLGLFPGGGLLNQIVVATIGAVILLVLIGLVRRV